MKQKQADSDDNDGFLVAASLLENQLRLVFGCLLCLVWMESQLLDLQAPTYNQKRGYSPLIHRQCRSVAGIHQELGGISRRAFRMEMATILSLFACLLPYLNTYENEHKASINGPINPSLHLFSAICILLRPRYVILSSRRPQVSPRGSGSSGKELSENPQY